MAFDTFSWRVHATASGSAEFVVATAQFGDGYSQRQAIGLNNRKEKWSATVSGWRNEMIPVRDFLRSKQGSIPFYWTPPLGDPGLYVCTRYTPQDQGSGYYTLSMEFEQVFGLSDDVPGLPTLPDESDGPIEG
jgi:phage-related protein